jgi:hypothetical protein
VYDFYRQELSEFAVRIWIDACAEFAMADIERAFMLHLKDPDAGRFLPKPADLVRQLRGSADDEAAIAWGQVLNAARGRGSVPADDLTHQALDALGGLSVLGRADESQNGYLQRRFTDAFKAHRRRALLDQAVPLLGNESVSLIGNHPPKESNA